jgi:hypothetical protein
MLITYKMNIMSGLINREGKRKLMQDNNNLQIDEKKIERLLKKLIIMEKQNIRSKQFNDAEMVKKIKKSIEEEVECF